MLSFWVAPKHTLRTPVSYLSREILKRPALHQLLELFMDGGGHGKVRGGQTSANSQQSAVSSDCLSDHTLYASTTAVPFHNPRRKFALNAASYTDPVGPNHEHPFAVAILFSDMPSYGISDASDQVLKQTGLAES
jgi:hypothetical protein